MNVFKWIDKIPLNVMIAILVYVYMIGSTTIMLDQYHEIQNLQGQIKVLQLNNR